MAEHVPVMVAQVLELLATKTGARLVDATLGIGGHAEALLRRLRGEATLVGIDRDASMLARAATRLAPFGASARLVHAPFSRLADVVRAQGLESVDGILLDLGVCSAQLDDAARGLSFADGAASGPLDMRLDRSSGRTAAELIEDSDEAELAALLREGGVPLARRVARALRQSRPATAGELAALVAALPLPRRRHHPATLVFQALRVAVNDELGELDRVLAAAVDLLAPGGRLVVLAYHSGEDGRVKRFLAAEQRGCVCPPRLPLCACGRKPRLAVLAQAERPSDDEISRNPRARSARLRGAERW